MSAGILTVVGLCMATLAQAADLVNLPVLPPPDEYGTILLDNTSLRNGMKAVSFSHRIHRMRYTCRVCHSELGFSMKRNGSGVNELASRSGRFCGSCHNGRISFKHNGNCDRCHTGTASSPDTFDMLGNLPLPRTPYGDRIDWVTSLERKVIAPQTFLKAKAPAIPFEKTLTLDAEWSIIPPAIFPHVKHTAWLECNSCHPDLFNIKKKGTHFSMNALLQGEYCGVCHLNVAFPLNNCKRCHPNMADSNDRVGGS